MQHYIDYITKKCHEANPDLLKMSLGCKVSYTYGDGGVEYFQYVGRWQNMDSLMKNWFLPVNDIDEERDLVKLDLSEIGKYITVLGHPIQLSDILMALSNEIDTQEIDAEINRRNELVIGYDCFYDLSKPFLEQSEETLKWIAEQLGYNQ